MLNISIFLFTVHYQEVHTLKFPDKLRILKNGLINMKNNDNRCFFWCDVRHSNLLKINPERIIKKKTDRKIINDLDYKDIKFPVSRKDLSRIEKKNNLCINEFYNKNYPVYVSDQKFEDFTDLLLITDENKSHYVYIKDFSRFMCNKTKNKNKKNFCRCCL